MIYKSKIRLNIKDLLLNISVFLILLYPFNATISQLIYPNNLICISSLIIGIVGIFLANDKWHFNKNAMLILVITMLVLLITLVNNYYFVEGRELKVILYSIHLILPIAIYSNKKAINSFQKIIKLFCIEHIVGTYIAIFFKDFYRANILSTVCSGKTVCTAVGNYYHGYIPGLTTHFSTNAIYLSIATLFYFAEFNNKKSKKSALLCIISLIALFTAGKRAHLIFTILCCIVLYILSKKKKNSHKYIKMLIIGIISIFAITLLSKFIPEITNIVSRFENLIESGDITNGRNQLYSLAFDLWDRHIMFGNGWGSYSYYYQQTLYNVGRISYLDAHNVFIQMLCEIGLIGTLFFSIIMIRTFIKTMSLVKKYESKSIMISFCFAYQLFFILYCFTGNPLYDPMCYVLYFITIGIILVFEKGGNLNEKNRNNNVL